MRYWSQRRTAAPLKPIPTEAAVKRVSVLERPLRREAAIIYRWPYQQICDGDQRQSDFPWIIVPGMHKYRLYVYDAEDRLIAPPMLISADNDESATDQAEKMLAGVRAELRDGDRLVMRHPNK